MDDQPLFGAIDRRSEDYLIRLAFWQKTSRVFTQKEIMFAADVDIIITKQGIGNIHRQAIAVCLMQIVTKRKAKKAIGQRAIFFLYQYILGDKGTRHISDIVQGCLWLNRTGMSQAHIFSVLTLLIDTIKP